MMSKARTHIMLIVLACVSAGVIGYFMWLFLAPAANVPPSKEVFSTEVQTEVVKGKEFRLLQPYAVLPIAPSNVGRPNPFLPLPIIKVGGNENENENENANENANVPQDVNG